MFIDLITIRVKAGDGGNGLVSFRREKHVSRGGPDGGDGGRGGDVVFKVSENEYDLAKFRRSQLIRAGDGNGGGKNRRRGKSGADAVVSLPRGTLVKQVDDSRLVADLVEAGQTFIVANGGEGGFGNAHFKSSTRRAPLVAEKGLKGEACQLSCELRLLAEVGLVGLPNAGKSTFLRAVTRARPKVGAYPFTTLQPHLGVSENGLRIADIPGLIAGAADGRGLGHRFLRHIERTLVLAHLLDWRQADPLAAYEQILAELAAYNPELVKRPQVLLLTKVDGAEAEALQAVADRLRRRLPAATSIYKISSLAGLNLKPLLADLRRLVNAARRRQQAAEPPAAAETVVFGFRPLAASFKIDKEADRFVVYGAKIETFARKTDFANYHARQRLIDIMTKMNVVRRLLLAGCRPDQPIFFGAGRVGPLYLDLALGIEERPLKAAKGRRGK